MNAPRDRFCGVLLAAGAGSRFGPDGKQLASLRGRPLLQWAIDAAGAASLDDVVVVLGARADAVRAGVDLGRATGVVAEGWAEGMAASLRCGVAAADAAGADWAVILLGDAPLLPPAVVDAVIAAAAAAPPEIGAVRLRIDDRPTHPVALRRSLFAAVAGLSGDVGARAVLDAVAVLELDGSAFGDPGDVDTVAALRGLG